jgi:hypothetical protein
MYMPQMQTCPDTFFELMQQMAREQDGQPLNIPLDGLLFDAREF